MASPSSCLVFYTKANKEIVRLQELIDKKEGELGALARLIVYKKNIFLEVSGRPESIVNDYCKGFLNFLIEREFLFRIRVQLFFCI